ncbi:hypothetical protein C8A05DRAFT_39184 [Staphylotrichum tortipilum]|uniref:Uncharacterized protein n=1 Tax=Staphylotrichum tortipilum TaxID=2831512 RepID=A0AAN6RN24_9PEZI|nr:hypothetical protein C8A05DRAFT_39184 [Staphylotrichum longicolle]
MRSRQTSPVDLEKKVKAAFGNFVANLKRTTPAGEKPVLPSPPQRDLYQCAMYLHGELTRANVSYYFCGGFACINVGMTARTTADIDIAVPNGAHGYGTLLDILSRTPFIQDKTGTLPADAHYFYVESSGNFVEVDGIIAGFMAFPTLEQANVVRAGQQMQLNFLEPAGLLRLKLSSWANRTRRLGPKRQGDVSDIRSIRGLLISNQAKVDLKALTSDTANGLKDWVKEFDDLKEWQKLDRAYQG